MAISQRENYMRTVYFDTPEYIPVNFVVNDACYEAYPQDFLWEMFETHPRLFGHFDRPEGYFRPDYSPVARKDAPYTDDFGCTWYTTTDGITGTVLGHPLKDWEAFADYRLPDPAVSNGIEAMNWQDVADGFERCKKYEFIRYGGLRHGHTFLQLCDLRGYENLLFDMMDEEERLPQLIDLIEQFNLEIVRRYLDLGAEMLHYPEDLGMQKGPMISPELFRKYIKPSYQRIMQPTRDKGAIVHMHSDGDLHDLLEDIIEGGVQVMNLQDLVNGIDWIRANLKDKVCIELDIDRQSITPVATPAEIDQLIRTEVEQLGSKQGGLMLVYGLYPGLPLENVKAVMDAMERYSLYYR